MDERGNMKGRMKKKKKRKKKKERSDVLCTLPVPPGTDGCPESERYRVRSARITGVRGARVIRIENGGRACVQKPDE